VEAYKLFDHPRTRKGRQLASVWPALGVVSVFPACSQ
jgi:hypothetical protein